jgi:DNA-binding response OmpR family regulator
MAETILIVDDESDTLDFLNLILTRQGYQVIQTDNGMDAIKLAHTQHPNLIVLDIMLPGMDGLEVARNLRGHPDTALIPILVFTAKTELKDKLAGYESGVDIYLTKPVHPVELQANIKALLTQRKGRAEKRTAPGYKLGVLAAKGGLGVSTVALNLAITCQQQTNTPIIAAELRPGQGSWAQELNVQTDFGLNNLLGLSQAEITKTSVQNQLLPSSYGVLLLLAGNQQQDIQYALNLAQYETILEQLSLLANLVVLDIGTGFIPAYEVIISQCDEILVITEPLSNAVRRTRNLLDDLHNKSFGSTKPLTLVAVNHTRAEMTLNLSQIEKILGHPVTLGFPPANELAYLSAERAQPMCIVQPDGLFCQQFNSLAEIVSSRAKL